MLFVGHTAKNIFAVCLTKNTQQTLSTRLTPPFAVCQNQTHGKQLSLPCANHQTHGEVSARACACCPVQSAAVTEVRLCHVSMKSTRQSPLFTVRQLLGTRRSSCRRKAQGRPSAFAVCSGRHTAKMGLCRVPFHQHTANYYSLP